MTKYTYDKNEFDVEQKENSVLFSYDDKHYIEIDKRDFDMRTKHFGYNDVVEDMLDLIIKWEIFQCKCGCGIK